MFLLKSMGDEWPGSHGYRHRERGTHACAEFNLLYLEAYIDKSQHLRSFITPCTLIKIWPGLDQSQISGAFHLLAANMIVTQQRPFYTHIFHIPPTESSAGYSIANTANTTTKYSLKHLLFLFWPCTTRIVLEVNRPFIGWNIFSYD